MNHHTLLEQYAQTEAGLRRRTTELRAQLQQLSGPEQDDVRKRLAVLQEELYDVELIRLDLSQRQRKEQTLC